ncbi:bifunctional sugar phosphate isomerase/epimerase/4-hydroxyphenylpyruvate dioxygenase family protein [Enterovibrio norvegicus]|uniref:bifunctional sugar phosphate isomerase/epimerase/4-hydroxyphenylpyruvate dioxygenase family protein n=1 Tax=Enterovibrio norvegicus TaxID=188144 RepID=UPI000C865921|nr:sugar phosphate isomerase/epimerase and 4-hydroxyphenylpyruvate domain-containing protein [Enterovibrio norvegicus]PMN70539.1 3-keto-5-aminohexanoate cleavage protein [Enterovibrio norvegicus]
MIYSIATVCLSGTLRQKIEAISKAGFRGIEIFENDLITHNGSVHEIRSMLDNHGLDVVTYQPFRDFEGLPAPYRQKAFDRAERKFDLMEELGTDLLMVCSSVSPHALGGIQRAADDFHELGERAAKRNMRVAYEALGWGKYVCDYRDSWEIVRRANHENVGVCLDTFHIFSRQTELDTMLNIPGDRIFLVQVADAPSLSMDHLSWSRHYRCFPGQGDLPLDKFVANMRATGYDGPFSLEIFNDQFRSGSTEKTARDGYRSLVFANQAIEKTPDIEPEKISTVSPPSEIQFIEFALSANEKDALSNILAQLGFCHTATHRKKDVELWRQGNINLVMNMEPDSFAQRFHQQHGVSVCAVGLTCHNVNDMVERANQLGFPPVYGNPETDTHGIPAIHGPGESLLYMVDDADKPAHWEREFVWHDNLQPQGFLNRVDHVATTMSYEEMLHSVLLYRSMFSMETMPTVDVSDPGGLVKSQALQTPDGAVSFTLNSSQSARTVSTRILDKYAGTGVNHIAFATTDIFAIAEFMQKQSSTTMAVTANYYDDIAARFSLSDDVLNKMKRFNILYDEDEHGTFFQLYTTLFAGRFCFEILQRNGYKGFGAANSQMRLTMQARELAG